MTTLSATEILNDREPDITFSEIINALKIWEPQIRNIISLPEQRREKYRTKNVMSYEIYCAKYGDDPIDRQSYEEILDALAYIAEQGSAERLLSILERSAV